MNIRSGRLLFICIFVFSCISVFSAPSVNSSALQPESPGKGVAVSAPLTAGIALWHYVTCFGTSTGWASASASGGTPPYTYSWNSAPAQFTDTASGLPAGTYTVTVTDAASGSSTAAITILQPAKLISSATRTNITCNGANNGTATANPSGGRLPYTYSWNSAPSQSTQTATALVPGTFIAYIQDSSACTTSDTITILQPVKLTSTATQTNISCNSTNNGTATAHPAGGRMPYTYSWNSAPSQSTQTATGLVTGTYIVYITDSSSCTTSDTVTITMSAALHATINITNISCNGLNNGSATANPSGGNPPYTYSWNTSPPQTGQTGAAFSAGTYIVYINDVANCTTSDTVTINEAPPFSISIDTVPVGCSLKMTCVDVGGISPFTWSWTTAPVQTTQAAITNISGTYTVTATDAYGCMRTDTVHIFVDPPPPVPTITLVGDTLYSSALTNNQWLLSGVPISSANGQFIVPLVDGVYTLQVSNGTCTVTSSPFVYTIAGLGAGLEADHGFVIYPNPGKGRFQWKLTQQVTDAELMINICDVPGKNMFRSLITPVSPGQVYTLDPGFLSNGIYFVSLQNKSGTVVARVKLLIQGE